MKNWRKSLLFFVVILLLCPTNVFSTIILNSTYREIDAGIGITYWVYPIIGDPYQVTKIDNPPALKYETSGDWEKSIDASVKGGGLIPTSYEAHADQNSTIILDTSNDVLSVSGKAKVYQEYSWGFNATYSMLKINFTIEGDSLYAYNFNITRKDPLYPFTEPVTDGYYSTGFSPNTNGVIEKGSYLLYIFFYNTGVSSFSPPFSKWYLSDDFSFVVQPYVAPPPTSVPEPGILILLGISMVSIAGLRIRWK